VTARGGTEDPGPGGKETLVTAVNIGPSEQRVRLIMGAASLLFGLAAAGLLWYVGISRWWRLLLILPFYNAALGFLQANRKTCVMMAGQGFKKMGPRLEKVRDAAEDAELRRQARSIFILSAISAAALTALSLLLPA
jgi:hypothetical protein